MGWTDIETKIVILKNGEILEGGSYPPETTLKEVVKAEAAKNELSSVDVIVDGNRIEAKDGANKISLYSLIEIVPKDSGVKEM